MLILLNLFDILTRSIQKQIENVVTMAQKMK